MNRVNSRSGFRYDDSTIGIIILIIIIIIIINGVQNMRAGSLSQFALMNSQARRLLNFWSIICRSFTQGVLSV